MGAADAANWERYYGRSADLEKTTAAAAANAATTSKDSFTKTIRLTPQLAKTYKFFFTYDYEDSDTKKITESGRSPAYLVTHVIENLTKPVKNLTLTQGAQSYGVKFDLDPLSVQEDVVIFESFTSDFATQTIVYAGTSNNVTILTTGLTAFTPRWVKVRCRDRWSDLNISEATAGPVTPFTADPDTTYTVANPTDINANASIDPKDLSGFSVVSNITWAKATNLKTAGYAIRWSTNNPATAGVEPLWEYASVSGIDTLSYNATGLIPNSTYYYQVASTTPYDMVDWSVVVTKTFIASDADGTAAGALARLKSFIAIGGATQDLFKIGTGISQSINLTTVPSVTPSLTAGTYHGIILNKSTTNVGNNFWLTTGQFRVGNPTEFMYWNGTNLFLTGNVNATGGKFTGNVQLAIPTGGTTSGVLYAGASPTTGARVRFNSEGIFAYNSTSTSDTTGKTFSLIQSTGLLDAPLGIVGGWTLAPTGFSSSNTKIENNGTITLGDITGTLGSIVRLSATDDYRLWIGSQSSSNAAFKVSKEGVLYATGAVIGGYPTTSAAATDAQTRADAAKAAAIAAAATDATTKANVAKSRADVAYDKAVAAADGVTAAELKITNTNNALALKVAATGVAAAINDNVTKIEGAKIVTGSIELSTLKVVGDTSNGLFIDNTGIKAYNGSTNTFSLSSSGALSLRGAVTATSGNIGGFSIGAVEGDLRASTTPATGVLPRIIFGDKVYLGWISGENYGFRIGNPYTDRVKSFRVQTITDVNRIAVDVLNASDLDYAAEIRNIVRAVGFRHMGDGFVSDSSRRYKENITEVPKHYYERILDVPINFYTYKTDTDEITHEMKGTHSFGPIAEDIDASGLGYFVQRDLSGQITSFRNEQKYPYLLIPIVRDLKLKVEQMEARILELESR